MIDFASRAARRFGAGNPIVAVFALALLLGATDPVLAQSGEAAQSGESPQNWVVQCGEETPKRCRAVQNIVMQKTNQRLLTVVVEPREGAPNHALVLALPHGVFLPAGATVKVDEGEPAPMVIQTSDANGAYAGMAISDQMLASLKKGTQLTVAFKTAQRQDIAVPVTLIGFTAAYTRLGS